MTETLKTFENEVNVTKITQTLEDGSKREAYLTSPSSYEDTKNRCGAELLDVSESGKVCLFFGKNANGDNVEVDSYVLSNNLKGLTPQQLIEKKHALLFFKSWFPAQKRWVKQVAERKAATVSKMAVKA